jgi:hypothetical protein
MQHYMETLESDDSLASAHQDDLRFDQNTPSDVSPSFYVGEWLRKGDRIYRALVVGVIQNKMHARAHLVSNS